MPMRDALRIQCDNYIVKMVMARINRSRTQTNPYVVTSGCFHFQLPSHSWMMKPLGCQAWEPPSLLCGQYPLQSRRDLKHHNYLPFQHSPFQILHLDLRQHQMIVNKDLISDQPTDKLTVKFAIAHS